MAASLPFAPRARRFEATPSEDGCPLEFFLANRLGLSRRAARRLLDERRVFVNGRRVWMARHRIDAGDRIEIQPGSPAAPPRATVLYDDDDVWVVDKPAGVLSTGPGGFDERFAADRGVAYARAVHRLDRDTTGCLILARSPEAFDRFVEWFRAGRVRKTYDAIAIGRFPPGVRVIREPVDGQSAVSVVRARRTGELASHVRVEILTGRTHQIRRHLLHAGHPIAGDRAYGAGRALPEVLRSVPRQMLHAASVSFPTAAGVRTVSAPLPRDFARELRRLRLAETERNGDGTTRSR